MKKEQVRTSKECLVMVQLNLSMDNINTMDELTVSFHHLRPSSRPNSNLKRQAWAYQGQSSHHEEKAESLAFFYSRASLTATTVHVQGRTVNGQYIIETISRFLRVFKQKRPVLATGDWWFHLDSSPMHSAAVVTNWMGARQFKIISHPL